jgi:hypothetical protein
LCSADEGSGEVDVALLHPGRLIRWKCQCILFVPCEGAALQLMSAASFPGTTSSNRVLVTTPPVVLTLLPRIPGAGRTIHTSPSDKPQSFAVANGTVTFPLRDKPTVAQ